MTPPWSKRFPLQPSRSASPLGSGLPPDGPSVGVEQKPPHHPDLSLGGVNGHISGLPPFLGLLLTRGFLPTLGSPVWFRGVWPPSLMRASQQLPRVPPAFTSEGTCSTFTQMISFAYFISFISFSPCWAISCLRIGASSYSRVPLMLRTSAGSLRPRLG